MNKKKKIIEECDTTFDKTKWLDNKKLTKLDKQRISLFRKAIHGQHPAIEKELVAQYKKTIEQGLVPTLKVAPKQNEGTRLGNEKDRVQIHGPLV